eukprot:TRINITY_DN900_c0_g1_i4.p1 TRINITY_DN900_c0_g1~~TRINITY_DN900_c0_g1_i4.p1  ORF type:complete len:132 (+),score=36.35 TRINITY_DN900_c0_g1_i4:312-707(+)
MTDLLTDLDRDLVNIQALVRDSMQQDPPASASIESDSQWEMVDSPEELKKPPQSLADFMADVIADQEEALGLSPEYPQVLLKLVQLIARTDEYRGRLSSNDLEKHECLKDGLTHLEEAGDRVRRFIEGTIC